MILDNEEQREMLVQVIDNLPLQGSVSDLNRTLVKFNELRNAVVTADIEARPDTGDNKD